MRRLVIILTLCVGCVIAADAQSSFTQRLQQSNKGEGKVTVTQDQAIDDLVNGQDQKQTVPQKQTERKESQTTTATNQKETRKPEEKKPEEKKPETRPSEDSRQGVDAVPDTTSNRRKVLKGYKVDGYRVQVFAGGNSRNDRLKAERTGNEIKSLFPDVPVYVHFYSPRWICRMGNYRSYEEAHEVLSRVKSLGYQSAIIVKGKITVSYQPASSNDYPQ